MRQILAIRTDEDEIPDQPDRFENDVTYIIETWSAHKLDGVYPQAGGYDDQDASLMRDWQRVDIYHMRAKAGVFSMPVAPINARGWQEIMQD